MKNELHRKIFKKGSKTYFNSSLFFPERIRQDVFTLYAFVRVADDLVDQVPPQIDQYRDFKLRYETALSGIPANDEIVDPYVELAKRKNFDPRWTQAFFHSMELDLVKKEYNTLDEAMEYIYGSAEVIGLFMARILDLPDAALQTAQSLGKSMQFINFLRDVAEDYGLGRRYLPLVSTELKNLTPESTMQNPQEFIRFMRSHVQVYQKWQTEAQAGYRYLKRRYLVPIKTASDMYNWTARQIVRDPLAVWKRKIKPSTLRIVWTAVCNCFYFPQTKKASA